MSGELNARLVLILANHIGDADVLGRPWRSPAAGGRVIHCAGFHNRLNRAANGGCMKAVLNVACGRAHRRRPGGGRGCELLIGVEPGQVMLGIDCGWRERLVSRRRRAAPAACGISRTGGRCSNGSSRALRQLELKPSEDRADEKDPPELYVVEERRFRGKQARVLSDGTIEAETAEGWMRFEDIEHLREYLDATIGPRR
jgi:hypothetical protein